MLSTLLAFILSVAGCGVIELERIKVSPEKNRLIIEAYFTKKTLYTIQAAQHGKSIILRVSDAVISEKLPTHKKITGHDPLSGWIIRTVKGMLEVNFLLTNPYEFSHSELLQKHPAPSASPYSIIIAINRDTLNSSNTTPESIVAQGSQNPLASGIRLYHEGRYNEALNEFNIEVRGNRHSPLAYYFAARIRLQKKQYPRASKNLLAAIRDSSDFADATAVLAITHREMGNTKEALAEWDNFVAFVGPTGDKISTVESIMLPEDYLEKQAQILRDQREAQEEIRKRLKAEQKEKEALAQVESGDPTEISHVDTLSGAQSPKTAQTILNTTTRNPTNYEIESRLGDFDHNIKTYILKGIYGIIVVIVLITTGFATLFYRRRKRRTGQADRVFASEINHFLEEKGKHEGKLDRYEENALRDYQIKHRCLNSESKTEHELSVPRKVIKLESPKPPAVEKPEQPLQPASHENVQVSTRGNQMVTEEIKTLVTRMYRENRSIEEICCASDLTSTEVELIIAVRAKRLELLIENASCHEEDRCDTDHLNQAISTLHSEGFTPLEIAKKLDVSSGIIQFALAVMKVKERQ